MRIVLAIAVAGMAGGVLAAVPDWQPLGENANGNKIYVDKAGGYAKTKILLRMVPRPTAIMACNDIL